MFNRLQSRRASSLLDMPRKRFAGTANPASQEPFSEKQFAEIICSFLELSNSDLSYNARDGQFWIQGTNKKYQINWTIHLKNTYGLDFDITYDLGMSRIKKGSSSLDTMFYPSIENFALTLASYLEGHCSKVFPRRSL